jgi:hypothetical protein
MAGNNTEATESDKENIVLPANIKPNYRSFYYGFDEKNHILIVEQHNESGQSFGPRRTEKFFRTLMENSPAIDGVVFSITTIPEDDAVEKILALRRLRRLTITILRPNPAEDLYEEEAEILKRIEDEHAKSETIEYIKAPGVPSLTPTERTRRLALIASRNGKVQGEGKDESGTKLVGSTDKHPKQVSYVIGKDFLCRSPIPQSYPKFRDRDKIKSKYSIDIGVSTEEQERS